jgi:hypothetical protein
MTYLTKDEMQEAVTHLTDMVMCGAWVGKSSRNVMYCKECNEVLSNVPKQFLALEEDNLKDKHTDHCCIGNTILFLKRIGVL